MKLSTIAFSSNQHSYNRSRSYGFSVSNINDLILCLFVRVNTETEAYTLIRTHKYQPCEDKTREVKVKKELREWQEAKRVKKG